MRGIYRFMLELLGAGGGGESESGIRDNAVDVSVNTF